MRLFLLLCFLCCNSAVFSHEGHHISALENVHEIIKEPTPEGRPTTWTQWIGSFHLIFLHFPIALINMLVISECLFGLYKKPIYEFSSRFMLISAAIITPITALFGLIYSYSAPYEGLMATFLFWHMWLGTFSAIGIILLAFIRELSGANKLYYYCLGVLFLLLNLTGYFGAEMTFGPYHMLPPL